MNAIKAYSHYVCDIHNERGSSFSVVGEPFPILDMLDWGWDVVNVTPHEQASRVVGDLLTPKVVRTILFHQRHYRWATREGAVLWTAVHPTKGVTLVGFGAIVRAEVADRFQRRHEDFVVLSRE